MFTKQDVDHSILGIILALEPTPSNNSLSVVKSAEKGFRTHCFVEPCIGDFYFTQHFVCNDLCRFDDLTVADIHNVEDLKEIQ